MQIKRFLFPLVFALLFSCVATALAEDAPTLSDDFAEGMARFAQGDYATAATHFAIQASLTPSAGLFVNAAQASLLSGDAAQALLWFERAALLAPSLPEVQEGLTAARQALSPTGAETASTLERIALWRAFLSPRALALAALILHGLAWLLLLTGRATARDRLRKSGIAALSVALPLLVATTIDYAIAFESAHRGIVLAQGSTARSGFSELATPLFPLSPGSSVTIRETRQDHFLVRNRSGISGWIPANDVGLVGAPFVVR